MSVSIRRWTARLGALMLCCAAVFSGPACRRSAIATSMSDQEFWTLIESLSEPPGTFSISDNFVSNEPHVSENIRWLRPSGGVYVGVGPEQNFSYIARLRPAIAFVIDIRRENRNLHLLVQGAVRVVERSRRLRVASLFAPAPARHRVRDEHRRDLQALRSRPCLAGVARKYGGAGPRAIAHHPRLPVVTTRSRLDRSRVRRVLRGWSADPLLGLAAPWTPCVRRTVS